MVPVWLITRILGRGTGEKTAQRGMRSTAKSPELPGNSLSRMAVRLPQISSTPLRKLLTLASSRLGHVRFDLQSSLQPNGFRASKIHSSAFAAGTSVVYVLALTPRTQIVSANVSFSASIIPVQRLSDCWRLHDFLSWVTPPGTCKAPSALRTPRTHRPFRGHRPPSSRWQRGCYNSWVMVVNHEICFRRPSRR
jgi:hypothetical protein